MATIIPAFRPFGGRLISRSAQTEYPPRTLPRAPPARSRTRGRDRSRIDMSSLLSVANYAHSRIWSLSSRICRAAPNSGQSQAINFRHKMDRGQPSSLSQGNHS